jgi:hypothetical protein
MDFRSASMTCFKGTIARDPLSQLYLDLGCISEADRLQHRLLDDVISSGDANVSDKSAGSLTRT